MDSKALNYAQVKSRMSLVLPHEAKKVWSVLQRWGNQAHWMGEIQGQTIFTQLLGGESKEYVGACRVFGIADKLIFEQLTEKDQEEMSMSWAVINHPMNRNPFPASFLNFKSMIRVAPAFVDWRMDLLTERPATQLMEECMTGIMKVGLLNLLKFLAAGARVSPDLERATNAPAGFGIASMPQPSSAPQMLYQNLNSALQQPEAMLASTYVPRPLQPLQQQPWARAFTAAGGGGDAGGGGGVGGMNSGGSAAGGGAGEGLGFSQAGGSGAFAGSVAPNGARGIASGGGGGGGSSIAAASSGMLMGSAAGAPTPAAGAGAQGHSVAPITAQLLNQHQLWLQQQSANAAAASSARHQHFLQQQQQQQQQAAAAAAAASQQQQSLQGLQQQSAFGTAAASQQQQSLQGLQGLQQQSAFGAAAAQQPQTLQGLAGLQQVAALQAFQGLQLGEGLRGQGGQGLADLAAQQTSLQRAQQAQLLAAVQQMRDVHLAQQASGGQPGAAQEGALGASPRPGSYQASLDAAGGSVTHSARD